MHVEAVVHPQNGKTRLEAFPKDISFSHGTGHAGRSSATEHAASASTSIKYVRSDTAFFSFGIHWAKGVQLTSLEITEFFARTQSKELEKLSDKIGMAEKSIRRPMQLAYLQLLLVSRGRLRAQFFKRLFVHLGVDHTQQCLSARWWIFVLFIYQKKMHGLSYAATLP